MRLLITGASGFIGRAVTAEAQRRGHTIRTTAPVDAIIHLAPTTDRMRQMIEANPTARFVLISSLAVYNFRGLPDHSLLDETTPITANPAAAGPYVITKLAQESLLRDHPNATILRPAIVHGPGRTWFHHLGMQLSPTRWLCLAPDSPLPLTSLANCTTAILSAIDAPPATLNLIDDNPPPRLAYIESLAAAAQPHPIIHTVSWSVLKRLASFGLGGLHDLLNPTRLATRCKPLRYSNELARSTLNWNPHDGPAT